MELVNAIKQMFSQSKKTITQHDIYSLIKEIKKPIILEAGAADGSDTLKFSKTFPDAIIHAFEPVFKNYAILKKTVCNQGNVVLHRLALSDYNGEVEINISSNTVSNDDVATSSSLLKPTKHIELHPQIVFEEKELVTTTTIDSWAEKNNITHVDVLWLDMQGMEYRVLKASPRILNTVKVIYTEVSLLEMYEGCILYEEYKKWILSQGFKIIKEELLWKDMGNVLFVRI